LDLSSGSVGTSGTGAADASPRRLQSRSLTPAAGPHHAGVLAVIADDMAAWVGNVHQNAGQQVLVGTKYYHLTFLTLGLKPVRSLTRPMLPRKMANRPAHAIVYPSVWGSFTPATSRLTPICALRHSRAQLIRCIDEVSPLFSPPCGATSEPFCDPCHRSLTGGRVNSGERWRQ
jgi:hypothetical protein